MNHAYQTVSEMIVGLDCCLLRKYKCQNQMIELNL